MSLRSAPSFRFALLGVGALALAGCPKPSDSADAAIAAPLVAAAEPIDRVQVVQALLDSPWVQNAFESALSNKTQPGVAAPLVVVVPPTLQGASLRAFGAPVRVMSPDQAQAQRPEAYLEITQLKVEQNRAQVTFRDQTDTVVGEALLDRADGKWKVAKVSGMEH